MPVSFDEYATLVQSRRTNLRIDRNRAVDEKVVRDLCGLAVWAPNHKLTEPWRFAILTGPSRATLGELAAEAQGNAGETDPAKLEKTRAKYLRAPVIVAVAAAGHDDPVRRAENRDAVAAGVQTLLLGATALGLASYWGTGFVCNVPAVRELCALAADDTLIALIYVGWPLGGVPVPRRSEPQIVWRS